MEHRDAPEAPPRCGRTLRGPSTGLWQARELGLPPVARQALFRGTLLGTEEPKKGEEWQRRGKSGGNMNLYTFIEAGTAWHSAAVPPLSSMPPLLPSQARSRWAAWARFSAPLCPWSEALAEA